MREKWELKGGKSYTVLMEEVRNGNKSHSFMKIEFYNELRKLWDSDGYKTISKIMSTNKRSDKGGLGGSYHSGGSIPATVHKRKLEEKFQKDYSLCDVYLFTYCKNSEEEIAKVLEKDQRILSGEDVESEGPTLVY